MAFGGRRHAAGMLLMCGVFLAAAGLAAATQIGSGIETATIALNRFGRRLQQLEAPVPTYLIPLQAPILCTGSECCQEDDYTSPYHVMMLNSTQSTFGGRTYTTFFMNLMRSYTCEVDVDFNGCCNATVSAVWIDVDPSLKVSYATMNGSFTAVTAIQDNYGFRMLVNTPLEPVATLISVTVEGSTTVLCPIPDLLGVNVGLCDVIVEGGFKPDNNATACCPRGLSIPSSVTSWIPPTNYFQCQSNLTLAPFNVTLDSVSQPFSDSATTMAVNYTLTVRRASSCREGPNSCCGMDLSYFMLKVVEGADVTALTFGGQPYSFSMAPWNEAGEVGFSALMFEGLNLTVEEVPDSGLKLVITLQLPPGTNAIPQLCSQPEGAANSGVYGACAYYMHSDDGFCCPAGLTSNTVGPVTSYYPPPPGSGTCTPQYVVPISNTSMTFSYYEYTASATETEFVFLLTDNNGPMCASTKTWCTDVCGWTLAVEDSITPYLTFIADDPANSGNEIVSHGASSNVTFTYGPSGAQSITYTIQAPAGTPLESLCRPNAYPDQGSWPCAAQVMSTSNVYSVIFFSQDSVFIKNYPPPSTVQPGFCDLSQPLTSSCAQVESFLYNSPDPSSTVFEFILTEADPSSGCTMDTDVNFRVLLQPTIVQELMASDSINPSSGVLNISTGATWAWSGFVNSLTSFSFDVTGTQTASSICLQGMPGQPDNSCPVQFEGQTSCFIGYVTPVQDNNLVYTPSTSGSSPKSKAAIIGPAVAVPLFFLLLLALAAFILYRRRRRAAELEPGSSGSSGARLGEPLNPSEGEAVAAGAQRSAGSAASAAASDIQIRL